MTYNLRLCTYNVLAPCWADPKIYPPNAVLDPNLRRALIIKVLCDLAKNHDVIALQETQENEISYFKNELAKHGFEGFHTNHRDDYWESYITVDPPFVSNGVALFWKSSVITKTAIASYDMSDDGNRGIIGTFTKGNKNFRIACVHLDSDTGGRRGKEAKALTDYLPSQLGVIDIILGDLNFNASYGPYNNIFSTYLVLNNTIPTHPFTSKYNQNSNYGVIDHILIRNATKDSVVVRDENVMNDAGNEADRVKLLLIRNGSDHFIVSGLIKIQ